MTFAPTITVVIPVYNGSDFLAEAIDSVLAQTYKNFDIVVVNDGSNDNGATDRVASSYGDKIKYFAKENGGVASALNVAISKAKGEYISWLSHDDLYTPDKLQQSVDFLGKVGPKHTIVYSDFSVFTDSPDQDTPVRLRGVRPDQFRYWITAENSLHGCTLLVPRQAFELCGNFDENLRTTQDYDLWFRMAEKYNFHHVPELLVKARSHAQQGTVHMADTVRQECNALLTKFAQNLTLEELSAGVEGHASVAYMELERSMHLRGFDEAAAAVKQLSLENPVPQDWNSRLKKLKLLLKIGVIDNVYRRAKSVIKKILPRRTYSAAARIVQSTGQIDAVNKLPLKEKFSEVYAKNIFGGEDSRSGAGSDLEQTEVIRDAIPEILKRYNVTSMLDAPCGDWFWMQHVDLGIERYIGADIVEDMIARNQKQFGRDGIEFAALDLSKDELPEVELIFSRDCLVHLSYEDALNMLRNFKSSGAKYLLTTTFTDRDSNEDLGQGFWRTLNMQIEPFNFPAPIELINEKCTEGDNKFTDKAIALWKFDELEIV